jgi:hypothetical protein
MTENPEANHQDTKNTKNSWEDDIEIFSGDKVAFLRLVSSTVRTFGVRILLFLVPLVLLVVRSS